MNRRNVLPLIGFLLSEFTRQVFKYVGKPEKLTEISLRNLLAMIRVL